MAIKIYVTGMHRGGTHSAAEDMSSKQDLFYIEEGAFRWDDLVTAINFSKGLAPIYDEIGRVTGYQPDPRLSPGFVCQCPMLAHKTLELAAHGDVYWCARDAVGLVTSMKNGGFNEMLWDIMRGFREEFPSDPIWGKLTYDGREDRHYGFVQYATILVKVKEYFYQKYFSEVPMVKLEDQEYYDETQTSAYKHPLSIKAAQLYNQEKVKNESILANQGKAKSN